MPTTLNIHDILSKGKKLYKQEQLTLLEKLATIIRKNEQTSAPAKLSKISGVGSKIWKKTNIDEYVDQERQW